MPQDTSNNSGKRMSHIDNALTKINTAANGNENSNISIDDNIWQINIQKKEDAVLASEKSIAAARNQLDEEVLKERIKNIEESAAEEKEKAALIAKEKEKFAAQVVKRAQILEKNFYKFASKETKTQMVRERAEYAKNAIFRAREKMAEIKKEYALGRINGNAANAQIKEQMALARQAGQEAVQARKDEQALLQISSAKELKHLASTREGIDARMDAINKAHAAETEQHEENIANLDDQIALLREKAKETQEKYGGDAGKSFEAQADALEAEKKDEEKALNKSKGDHLKEGLTANAIKGMTHAMNEGLKNLSDGINKAVDSAISEVGKYRSGIEARLQGSQSSYDSVAKTLKKSLSVSPFVKQKEVLEKLNDAVNKGIAYNVEQRAFLATMTDKIVSTFDAFDANLTRLIRLQQADTTAARMGMESQLLYFFNETYSDSSYLSEHYDNVSQAIIDASSNMTREMSISFEYNIQKWLGSLASLGFSGDTITTIAQGINYLGSGNVQALSGNEQLQRLLAMSASRANLSYSEMLVGGINDSEVNILLKSMVEYLREIASDNNKVVKAAYGDIFNFTQSDLKAISNITDNDIAKISSQTMDYSKAMTEIQSQLNQVGSRLSTTEMIDNVFENFLYTSGETIGNNIGTAITWKLLSVIEGATGGIHFPNIGVMGNFVDLSTFTVEGIMKTGIFGLSALSNLGNMLSSIKSGGGLDLNVWGGTEYVSRGGMNNAPNKGIQKSTSYAGSQGTSNEGDIKQGALTDTKKDQETMKRSSKDSAEGAKNIDDLYKAVVAPDASSYIMSFDESTFTELHKTQSPLLESIKQYEYDSRTYLKSIHDWQLAKPVNTISANISTMGTILKEITKYDEKNKEGSRTEAIPVTLSSIAKPATKELEKITFKTSSQLSSDKTSLKVGNTKYKNPAEAIFNLLNLLMTDKSINIDIATSEEDGTNLDALLEAKFKKYIEDIRYYYSTGTFDKWYDNTF